MRQTGRATHRRLGIVSIALAVLLVSFVFPVAAYADSGAWADDGRQPVESEAFHAQDWDEALPVERAGEDAEEPAPPSDNFTRRYYTEDQGERETAENEEKKSDPAGLYTDTYPSSYGLNWGDYNRYHHHCDSCVRNIQNICKEGCLCPCPYCVAYQQTFRRCRCDDCNDPDCTCECEPGSACTCVDCGGYVPPLCECGCASLQEECDRDGGCGKADCTCESCLPAPVLCECGCASLQEECDRDGGCGNEDCTCESCLPAPILCECGCGSLQEECDRDGGCGKADCTCESCLPAPILCECGCASLQEECDRDGGCGNEDCTCESCLPAPILCECGCASLQEECDRDGGCGKADCTCESCLPAPILCECGCGSLQEECDRDGGCGKADCTCESCVEPDNPETGGPELCECGCGSLQEECDRDGGCGNEACTGENCLPGNPATGGGGDGTPPDTSRPSPDRGSGGGGSTSTPGQDTDPALAQPEPDPVEEPEEPEEPEDPEEELEEAEQQRLSTVAADRSSPVVDSVGPATVRELPVDEMQRLYRHAISVGATTPLTFAGEGGGAAWIYDPPGADIQSGTAHQENFLVGGEAAVTVSSVEGRGAVGAPALIALGGCGIAVAGAGAQVINWLRWRRALRKLSKW